MESIMTEREAEKILEMVFIAFPYAGEYLERSAYPQQTHAEWCRMLRDVDWKIAIVVVDRWKSGELAVPDKPWEMGMLPLKLKAVASRIADERAKRERIERMQAETRERMGLRSGHDNLPQAIRASLRLGSMLRDGKINEDRHNEILKDLLKQSCDRANAFRMPEELRRFVQRLIGLDYARSK
jgi:hypothetical protein